MVIDFATQSALAVAMNYLLMFFAFPVVLAANYQRQLDGRADVLCCCATVEENARQREKLFSQDKSGLKEPNQIASFVTKVLMQPFSQGLVIVLFVGLLVAASFGAEKLEEGRLFHSSHKYTIF